jgi:ribulose-5-phosphate 4-epimerase/fuculose-1-phosphate aldolase
MPTKPQQQLTPDDQCKQDLTLAYHFFAELGMDDLTYTHLSARPHPGANYYYIYPFGQLFEEVSENTLLKVSLDGELLEGSEYQYNKTGYTIHGSLYKARPDIQAIYHLHTIDGVAVSALKEGLLPISQFAFHFYNRISYHNYDSLTLNGDQGAQMAKDLGPHNKAMILRNHGTLTAGSTIQEAFFYMYYLEKACRAQCKILSMTNTPLMPPADVCEKTAQDMRNFEPDLGQRDWQALKRKKNMFK